MLWPGLTPAQEYARSRDLSQLVCRGCRTTLLYPRGASAVQCAVCRTLNPARQVRTQFREQMVFWRATMWNVGERRARDGTCNYKTKMAVCQLLAACPIMMSQQQQQPSNWSTLTCGGCRQPLTYTSGAEYVRCAACQFMNRAPRRHEPEAPAPAPQVKTVIVENPPLLDEQGNEVC